MSATSTLLQAASGAITATGVCAAGGWTLYNFGLRRIAKPRVHLSIGPPSVEDNGTAYVIYITVTAANEGNTKVKRGYSSLRLTPLPLPDIGKNDFDRIEAPGGPKRTYDVFQQHTFLEPGEVFQEDVAVQCLSLSPIQLDLEFRGDGKEHAWSVSRMVHLGGGPGVEATRSDPASSSPLNAEVESWQSKGGGGLDAADAARHMPE